MADGGIPPQSRTEYGVPIQSRTEYAINAEARQRRHNRALRQALERAEKVTPDGPDHRS